MNIDYQGKVISMSTSEAKKAGKYGSEEFQELKELRAAAPDFPIVIVKAFRKRKSYDHLTYTDMETYIKEHDTKQSILTEFYLLCGRDADGNKMSRADTASYGAVKRWFLDQHPEIKNSANNIQSILNGK